MTGKFLQVGAPLASWLSHSLSMRRLHSASLFLTLALCCLQRSFAFHLCTSCWLVPAFACLRGVLLFEGGALPALSCSLGASLAPSFSGSGPRCCSEGSQSRSASSGCGQGASAAKMSAAAVHLLLLPNCSRCSAGGWLGPTVGWTTLKAANKDAAEIFGSHPRVPFSLGWARSTSGHVIRRRFHLGR